MARQQCVMKWLLFLLLLVSGSIASMSPDIEVKKGTSTPTPADSSSLPTEASTAASSQFTERPTTSVAAPQDDMSRKQTDLPELVDSLMKINAFEDTSERKLKQKDTESIASFELVESTKSSNTSEGVLTTTAPTAMSTTAEETSTLSAPTPDAPKKETKEVRTGLFDREKLVKALKESFQDQQASNQTNQQGEPQKEFMMKSLEKVANTGKSTALSGNEPNSGPSPDGFGPVEDIFPVVFPQPASEGREEFVPENLFERGAVSRHFADKERFPERDFVQYDNDIHEGEDFNHPSTVSTDQPHFDLRQRTPKPGKRPMLMTLHPTPLNKEGGKKLVDSLRNDRRIQGLPIDSAIGVEAKGDHGQIQRIPHVSTQSPPLGLFPIQHKDIRHILNRPIGLLPAQNIHGFSGLDPLLFESNLISDHDYSPPQRRFSGPHITGPTPPPGLILSTLNPNLLNYNDPFLQFAPRQLPVLAQSPSIFHRPTVSYQSPSLNNDERRRPLTRDHFSNFNEQHLSTFVTPREPDIKRPFGTGLHEEKVVHHDPVTGRPTVFAFSSTVRPPTNAHGDPYYSLGLGSDDSHFLRPMSPRPTTIRDSLNPSTFFNFAPSTPLHNQFHPVTPIPPHLGPILTPQPPIVNQFASNSYLPTTPYQSSSTTITPLGPIIASTPTPIISTLIPRTRGPLDVRFPNRGASRFTPPQPLFDNIIGQSSHSDFSSQYHSGEHLSHGEPQQHVRPWLAHNDIDSDEKKEYTYHYAVHSPSTGDVKSAHETRLPHGGVVGGYSLLQPDGLTRQVSYTADKFSGFKANVEYLPPRPALRG